MSTLFTHFFDKINQISPLEANFTEVLESIALKPKMLYFYGKMPENMSKNAQKDTPKSPILATTDSRPKTVAIVGSRHNTKYGEEVAYHLAYELGKYGVVVVSGLAFGIDSIAHRGCLDAGGVTAAVLGTRINDIYPKSHLPLAQEIINKNGVILSEYAPKELINTAPLAPGEYIDKATNRRLVHQYSSFLYRNRIISGLSDIVVVVEAAKKSGSLNTATHALEQGKEVFAVPGNITNPYSQGCNKLISQGAFPYTEPNDILKLLFPDNFIKNHQKALKNNLFGDNDVETAILTSIARGIRSGEEIMQKVKLPPEIFNQTITLLEIKNRVHSLGMNQWSLSC
ncbi:DNA-protecting protein DprA [Candidatus Saccharibacteria bacterium]|nr:DNA-protecting protein DprA [Candidatus Saccharibacteria bacterium]